MGDEADWLIEQEMMGSSWEDALDPRPPRRLQHKVSATRIAEDLLETDEMDAARKLNEGVIDI